ncbi:major facilitator superfamily protein [Sarocladium implicatum]|nr:major facilitator superfamily protein [Sarocladium implicatum]
MRHDAIDSTDQNERQGLTAGEQGGRQGRDVVTSTENALAAAEAANLDEEEGAASQAAKSKPIAWRDLPRRDQLLILTLARLSEPLTQTSLQSYLFYQLKWFDESLPDATISVQAGTLTASFTAAQFLTAMLWGRVADSPRAGRKTVILIGLSGTAISCLGFGFSTSFWQALCFRTLGGITNGNVGVMRTMISEIIREKKYQSRAFLLLPMTFNIGVIVGPVLGGLLSDPAGSYPSAFGDVAFFKSYPYATPNLVSFFFLSCSFLAVWLGLEETLDSVRDGPPDLGLRIGRLLVRAFRRSSNSNSGYEAVPATENETDDVELRSEPVKPTVKKRFTQRLAFRRIFTRNVTMTLVAHFLLALCVGSFNSLWFVFLSTPVHDPVKSKHSVSLPFHFTGGIGMKPATVGVATAILGVIGITMQLCLYPPISHRLGTVLSWRLSLLCFPIAYILVPFLSIVPSTSDPPAGKTGALLWLGIVGVLFFAVTGRTFALPGQNILVNNCCPHPSVLGTVHGVAQSVSSLARTIGPIASGFVYGYGLDHGVVGTVFWCMSGMAMLACLASLGVREGDGHEVWLEGDVED